MLIPLCARRPRASRFQEWWIAILLSYRPYAFGTREQIDAHHRETLLRYAAYDEARDRLARGEPPQWPEGMYAPGGAVAA